MVDTINVILDNINNPIQFTNNSPIVLPLVVTGHEIIISNQNITVLQRGSDQYTIQFHNVLNYLI